MKWPLGLCASILMEEFFFPSLRAPKPRLDRNFPGVAADPAFTSNALAANWGLFPEAAGGDDATKLQAFAFAAES
jgi:hypothetical protein